MEEGSMIGEGPTPELRAGESCACIVGLERIRDYQGDTDKASKHHKHCTSKIRVHSPLSF